MPPQCMGSQWGLLHAECDWPVQYSRVRKEGRAGEVESLQKAKAVLSGADYSLLLTVKAHVRSQQDPKGPGHPDVQRIISRTVKA